MKIFSKTLAPLIFALPLAAQTSAKENTLSGLPPCPQGTPSKNWTNCDGKVRYPSGATYEGAYIDGKHNGKGKYVTPDGVTYEGNHRDNKRNGRFVITYADGKKREATYEDNKLKSDQDLNRPQDRLTSDKPVPAPATRAGDEKQSERKPMMEDRRLTAEANQSTPSIKEGVDYRKARQALIDAGWEPVPQTESTSFFGEEIRRTYREVKDCAGTGKAPCIFVFKGKNGRTLHIHTTGEDPKFARSNLEQTIAPSSPSFGTLTCYTVSMTLKKNDGSTQKITVPSNAKPFVIKQDGNALTAIYPGGPSTAYHGATFIRTYTESADGIATSVRRFERRTPDSAYAIDIAKNTKSNGYTMLAQSVSQGAPNMLITVHNCQ